MINIALRFDDPSISSNHDLEKEVIAICSRHDVKINFAVIPFKIINQNLSPLTTDAAKHLVDAEMNGLIEISQHGHSHQNNATTNTTPSEFKGRPIEEQVELIKTGKSLLDSIFIQQDRGFVPPWNTFDYNTLLATNQLRFRYISGGWEIPKNHKASGAKIIPRTTQVSDIRQNIKQYKLYSPLKPILVAVLHHYDFIESESNNGKFSLNEFEETIKIASSSRHVNMTSQNNIAQTLTTKNLNFGLNAHYLITKKLHWRIQKYFPTPLFFHGSSKI